MRFYSFVLVVILLVSPVTCNNNLSNFQLWYNSPAENWNEALPIGNGFVGAMLFGGVTQERLQLNESTLYSGEPATAYKNIDLRPLYPKVIGLIKDKKYEESHKLVKNNWAGRLPQSYQPLGDFYINFEHDESVANYKRILDIEKSIYTVSYSVDGTEYKREIFASYPDNVILVKLTCSSENEFGVNINYSTQHPASEIILEKNILGIKSQVPGYCERRTLEYLEQNNLTKHHPELFNENGSRKHEKQLLYANEINGDGMRFTSCAKIITGKPEATENGIRITGKNEIIILLSAATSYNGFDKSPSKEGIDSKNKCLDILNIASKKDYRQLLDNHIADYQLLFNRVNLQISSDKDYSQTPTNKRIKEFKNNNDNDLTALLFRYGRYLLISSSRKGGQPANLQGMWNNDRIPPWNCAYTLNINAQMNYWHAETTGLSECLYPFFTMIKEFSKTGKEAARNMYGLPGWVIHHNASIWREAYPTDGEPTWFFWNMGGGWLCRHLWEHYLFTEDKEFLREEAYPLMKSAGEFYYHWLIQNEDGYWLTPISTSPENFFLTDTGNRTAISSGSTMDRAIIYELFKSIESASQILDVDSTFRYCLKEKREKLLPYKIGRKGQLQEWEYDFDELDPTHRHLSHLYGFYPGNEISYQRTPNLIPAIENTLLYRGDEATGWSMGWKINLWARMRDGNHAYKIIQNLFTPVNPDPSLPASVIGGGLYPNLLDAHPPFQIDGNFGFTAGVTEMLLQSHDNELYILPALPDNWKDGKIEGLFARGGFVVDIDWQNNEVHRLKINSVLGNKCVIRTPNKSFSFDTEAGKIYEFNF